MMVMEWVDGYDLEQLLVRERLDRVEGRVSRSRWEYINRNITTVHGLWHTQADGTGSLDAHLLLVDDNPTNLQVLFQTLSGSGYELLIAQSGAEALKVAESTHPDMVLLDVRLPGISGIEAIPEIRKVAPNLPVLLITAYADLKQAVAAGETLTGRKSIHTQDT